ncbi:MAG: S8 family serine peptidase [Candidatus Marinimicrobia bacterium]|nr:S8 family serine peptidase [Candidatus Neomarinimicrobiota bacterium]
MNTLRRILRISVLFLALFASTIAQESVFEREIIVMFKPGIIELPVGKENARLPDVAITAPEIKKAMEKRNVDLIIKAFPHFKQADTLGVARTGERVKLADLSHIYKIRLTGRADISETVTELTDFPEVIFAEPNGLAEHDIDPNDQHFDDPNNPGQGGLQWSLLNTGQNGGTYDADIDAPEAWDITKGHVNTKIAIIDPEGVWSGHPDLSGKVSGDSNTNGSHGTHVAGIAAAKTNNTIGIAGIDWYAQIIAENIYGADDDGRYNAVMSAINRGADILTNSWRLIPTGRNSTIVRMAFANAYKSNIFVTASMGNTGNTTNTVQYPAAFGQGITAVGATTKNDVRRNSSTYGYNIDVVAPGEDILSTVSYYNSIYGGCYDKFSGTSMATPHVSGIAGLLLAKEPNLYNDDIEQIIRISADKVDAMKGQEWTTEYGNGRVNARAALDLISSPNQLNHWTANAGNSVSNTGTYTITFFGTPSLAEGSYTVKRYDVQKTVTFSQSFIYPPYVWGRGVATNGYSGTNPNYGMGWCNVVGSTVTTTGATLQTYVYEVWNNLGQYLGYFPTTPENTTFAYTALTAPPPPLAVSISGPGELLEGNTGTWTANVTGGENGIPYSYAWEKKNDGSNQWYPLGTSQSQSVTMGSVSFTLMVTATQGTEYSNNTTYYVFRTGGGGFFRQANADHNGSIPEIFSLSQNYPNPFNPITTIKYELPVASSVSLVIYDLRGNEVTRWVMANETAGYKRKTWNATDKHGNKVPAGVYLLKMTAESKKSQQIFTETRKMALIK